MKKIDKFQLYEKSVQDPKQQVDLAEKVYKHVFKKEPKVLREDFCGTFLIACDWVTRSKDRKAIALDLDNTTLGYGKKNHLSKLTPEQQKRVFPKIKNVMSKTTPGADVILGCNFSFNVFKEWETLIKYFKAAKSSLSKEGVFILEAAGGPGMIEETKERRRYRKNKKHWFTYIWDQQSYDPISGEGRWAIHFKMGDGRYFEDAFVYDWRLWTIPDLRLAMRLAGFKDSIVFWEETDEDGDETGVWSEIKKAENDHTWICYIVGVNS